MDGRWQSFIPDLKILTRHYWGCNMHNVLGVFCIHISLQMRGKSGTQQVLYWHVLYFFLSKLKWIALCLKLLTKIFTFVSLRADVNLAVERVEIREAKVVAYKTSLLHSQHQSNVNRYISILSHLVDIQGPVPVPEHALFFANLFRLIVHRFPQCLHQKILLSLGEKFTIFTVYR